MCKSQDDIIVWGNSKEQHDEWLKAVFDHIRQSGLKLNAAKCVFEANELTFLGHVVLADGVKPDPKKVEAITEYPMPENKTELQRFLGMVTYLGKFIPKLSQETAPLRELLKKNMEFVIQKPQKDAFDRLKTLISTIPVLQYYNPNLLTQLCSDSSRIGLGAMIEQEVEEEWHPVAFSSRALNTSEQNYAQIEHETLSVVFGCERFHEYVYGRQFIIQNDHKPLKSIFSKSIIQCLPMHPTFLSPPSKVQFPV